MITLFYACALTILALVLAYLTGRQRFKTGTNLGLGDSFELLQISTLWEKKTIQPEER